jgi:hypothetical protein
MRACVRSHTGDATEREVLDPLAKFCQVEARNKSQGRLDGAAADLVRPGRCRNQHRRGGAPALIQGRSRTEKLVSI